MPSIRELKQFLQAQLFETPGRLSKSVTDVDVEGKTIVITGANSGLGFECAKELTRMKVGKLFLACRDLGKGESARKAILAEVEGGQNSISTKIEVWHLDLDSFDSVVEFGKRIQTRLSRLDGFVANAGVSLNEFELSQAYERTLTVNVLSTFLLAVLVLPKLKETAKVHRTPVNLTIVGSIIHFFAPYKQLKVSPSEAIFKTLSDPTTADMKGRYFLSKLIVQLCFREFAKRITNSKDVDMQQIVVNCVNPGWCQTPLFRHDDGGLGGRIGLRMIGRSAEIGSRTLVHAVTAGSKTRGQFLSECRDKPSSDFVQSAEGLQTQERLWEELCAVIKRQDPRVLDILRL